MKHTDQPTRADSVRLAVEPKFRLGRAEICPATREVLFEGRVETIEPRVMQVLVVLARANGEVVSRDELIERCWDGRIVTEDAVTRVLSQVRRLGNDFCAGLFNVHTIRGVGCRLVVADQHELESAAAPLDRRHFIVGGTALIAGAGAWTFISREQKQVSPLAKEYYRRGIETRGQDTIERTEQGAALFREAVRIDPQFADAWGALAWNYRVLLDFAARPDAPRLQALSRSAAQRALALDPGNADAQSALLFLKPYYRNWAVIETGCRTLLKQHPGNSILEGNLGFDLCQVGRWKDSLPLFRSVAQREPFWPLAQMVLGLALYSAGLGEEGDDLVETGMKRFPGRSDFWLLYLRHLMSEERFSEAVEFANDPYKRPDDHEDPRIDLAILVSHAIANGSNAARVEAFNETIKRTRKSGYLESGVQSACTLGKLDTAFEMLDGMYFGRGPWAKWKRDRPYTDALFVPEAAPLRSDPRFDGLIREIGLEEYWRSTRTLPDYRRSIS